MQIIQLLKERNLSYTMCINKMELTTTAGLGLMLQLLDVPAESKLYKDTQLSLSSIVKIMEDMASSSAAPFKNFSASFSNSPKSNKPESRRSSSSSSGQPAPQIQKSSKGHLQAIVDRCLFNGIRQPKLKSPYLKQEASVSCDTNPILPNNLAQWSRIKGNASTASLSSAASDPVLKSRSSQSSIPPALAHWNTVTNLDYLPLGSQSPHSSPGVKHSGSPDFTDWDHLISTFDPFDISAPQNHPQHQHLASNMQGSSPHEIASSIPTSYPPASMPVLDWSAADWTAGDWGLLDMLQQPDPTSARSVLSLSDESLTSGEELSSCDQGSEFRGYSIPNEDYPQDELAVQQAAALS